MPWEPWLQLNWELQNGGEIATEVHSASRKLESETAIQKTSEKRVAEWRGIRTKLFPTKWHRKKSSDVRSTEILWTLSRLRGNNSQTSFPTYSAINMHSPDTPPLPSHLSLCLQGSNSPWCSVHSKGNPTWLQHWLMKTHMGGREGTGSGAETTPGWEEKTPKPVIGVTSWS